MYEFHHLKSKCQSQATPTHQISGTPRKTQNAQLKDSQAVWPSTSRYFSKTARSHSRVGKPTGDRLAVSLDSYFSRRRWRPSREESGVKMDRQEKSLPVGPIGGRRAVRARGRG